MTRDQLEAILTQLSEEGKISSRDVVDELVEEWFAEDIEATSNSDIAPDIKDDRFGIYIMEVYEQDYDTIVD